MTSEEARAFFREMEGYRHDDAAAKAAAALRVLVEEVRPDEPIDTTLPDWGASEHSVWTILDRVRECLDERKDLRGKTPLLDAVAELCLDQGLGRGRQIGVLLLGERGQGQYVNLLNRMLSDRDVYGHSIEALNRSDDRSQKSLVEKILASEKHGWVRRAAKKYLEPPKARPAKPRS